MRIKLNSGRTQLLGALVCCVLIPRTEADAQTNYQRLLSLGPAGVTGGKIVSSLMEGSDGVLYGATSSGGTNNGGTIFKVNKDGTGFSVLYGLPTGSFVNGRLVEGSDGALYGTTEFGGTNQVGTIFTIDRNGSNFSILHNFATNSGDGGLPLAGLCKGADGGLYGTTSAGGASNLGTIYRLNEGGGEYSLLYSFGAGGGDGSNPYAGVMQATDGALYGTTQNGGRYSYGTVYRIYTNGTGYMLLHEFSSHTNNDGRLPYGGLAEGNDGFLYGTTVFGGSSGGNLGTVFKLDKAGGSYAVVHNFIDAGDGSQPFATPWKGSDGALYGTTSVGGTNGLGCMFRLDPGTGEYSILYNFGAIAGDGSLLYAGVVQGNDGAFYGSTYAGGDTGNGTVFRLFSGNARVRISSIQRTGEGALLKLVGGAAGQAYNIQATTNLGNSSGWQVVGTTNAAIDGSFLYLDAGATNYRSRYYRSAMP